MLLLLLELLVNALSKKLLLLYVKQLRLHDLLLKHVLLVLLLGTPERRPSWTAHGHHAGRWREGQDIARVVVVAAR